MTHRTFMKNSVVDEISRASSLKPISKRARSCAFTFLVFTVSCQAEKEEAMTLASSVIVDTGILRQPNTFPIPVCFRTDGDGSAAELAMVREVVEQQWENLPRVIPDLFTGWESCLGDEGPGTSITVLVDSAIQRGLTSSGGWIVRLPATGSVAWRKRTAVHEFGHVLGLEHEQRHPDKPEDCSESESLGSGLVLTSYDPTGVLNYCSPQTHVISDKERLFAEMAYPNDTQDHPVRPSLGYVTAAGLLLPVGQTVRSDWTARGALPSAFDSIEWSYASGTVSSIEPPPFAATGPFSVDYSFVDFRGVAHTGQSINVTVNDSHFAALTSVIL